VRRRRPKGQLHLTDKLDLPQGSFGNPFLFGQVE
jgi:hypothetical protein